MPSRNVVLLTNFVPPYRIKLYQSLHKRLGNFRVLISTPMEADRPWKTQHGSLNVETQRTLTFRRRLNHPYGFQDEIFVHIPYDTLGRLRRIRPEVILSDELGARTAQALIYRWLHPDSRLIIWATISEHTEEGRSAAQKFLRRTLLPFADAVLVNGASGARYIRGFGVEDERIFVAPQVTDQIPFCSLPLERQKAEQRRLIYAGRLIELKGLTKFLSVLCLWCAAHSELQVEFWLVGDGPERQRLSEITLPSNLQLRFYGNIGYDKLPEFYARAEIMVFPTLADTWGLVVNEAMASGLPILGSTHSQAVEDLVEDGVTGWTFRPDFPDEMHTAIDHSLMITHEKLQQMSIAARKAVEHLTPEFVAGRILEAVGYVRGERRNQVMPVEPLTRKNSA